MNNKIRIAVDGPSGAGKSTVAKGIAEALGIDYVDTGAMYRAIGYKVKREKINLFNKDDLMKMLSRTTIDFNNGDVILDGQIVSDKIRTPEVTKIASEVSTIKEIRDKLVAIQREMGKAKSLVMDGRDIGTNVFPDAEYKWFITATLEERARRRWMELLSKGEQAELAQIKEDIRRRDYSDSTRDLNPLKKAADAVEIDTTDLSEKEVVHKIMEVIKWQS